MKRMSLYMLIVAVLAVFSMSAAAEDITLNVMTWGNDPVYAELSRAFEKENPGIKVNLMLAASVGDLTNKLMVMTAGGTPVDVFWTAAYRAPSYAPKGICMPLNDLISPSLLKRHAAPVLQAFTYDGKLLGIPWTAAVAITVYNKELLARAGVDDPVDIHFDDFRQIAKKLTISDSNKRKQYGFEQDRGIHVEHWWISAFGGEWVDSLAKTPTASKPESIKGFKAIAEMILEDRSTVRSSSSQQNMYFTRGESAMTVVLVGTMSQFFKTPYELGIGRVPRGTTRGQAFSSSAWSVNSATKYPKEAVRYVEFVTSPESMAKTTLAGRSFPTMPSLISSSPELFKQWPQGSLSILAQSIADAAFPNAYRSPYYSDYDRLRESYLNQVFSGKLAVESAVLQLDHQAQSILNPPAQ